MDVWLRWQAEWLRLIPRNRPQRHLQWKHQVKRVSTQLSIECTAWCSRGNGPKQQPPFITSVQPWVPTDEEFNPRFCKTLSMMHSLTQMDLFAIWTGRWTNSSFSIDEPHIPSLPTSDVYHGTFTGTIDGKSNSEWFREMKEVSLLHVNNVVSSLKSWKAFWLLVLV